jgi:surface antigen
MLTVGGGEPSLAAAHGRSRAATASDRGHGRVSLSVQRSGLRFAATVRAPVHSPCTLSVSTARSSYSFEAIRTGRQGRGTLKWQAATDSPAGRWTFSAGCMVTGRMQRAIVHLQVSTATGGSGTGVLVVPDTTQLSTGAQFAAPAVTPPAAGTDGYPDWNMACEHSPYNTTGTCANYDWGPAHTAAYNDQSEYSSRGYAYRNCTDYVAWKIQQQFGISLPTNLGSANTWGPMLKADAYHYDSMPQIGDIAAWNSGGGGFGHVAYVYDVNGGIASLDEYNVAGTGVFSSNRTTAGGSAGVPDEYIHIGTMSTVSPQVTAQTLLQGTVGASYSAALVATGGTAPYSWGVTSGAPPPGLAVSSGGVISGVPTSAGSYTFSVAATGSNGASSAAALISLVPLCQCRVRRS